MHHHRPFHRLPTRLVATGTLAAALLVLGACASTPMPTEDLAVADAAVARASATRTQQQAPVELAVAVGKLSSARAAVVAGDADRARRLAQQAALDAQVAEVHADAVQSTAAARESEEAARVLREEIVRKTPR